MGQALTMRWYVCRVQHNKERIAIVNLNKQGYTCWLPQISQTVRRGGAFVKTQKPMFPGYVFVQLDLAVQRWRPIDGTFGVNHIVTTGGRPTPLPQGFVEHLQSRVSAEHALLTDVELENANWLKVSDGVFADLIGRVTRVPGQERVTLLLDLMSRSVPVTVSSKSVMMALQPRG